MPSVAGRRQMARIQTPPAFFSYSTLLPDFFRHAQSHNWSIRRIFSNESIRCRHTALPFSGQPKRGFTFQEESFASAADLYVVAPLKVIEYPDPILRAKNRRINTFDNNLKKLVIEMFDVMYKTDGIGLSAPQVGINVQLIVCNPAGESGEGEEIVLINPLVHKTSKKALLYNEGCLSFPGIYADVVRPASVKIDARDISGARFGVNLSGLPARIFQHEFDHLKGTLFFDRMTEDVRDGIRSELKALEKKYEDRTGQPSPEKIENYKPRRRLVLYPGSSLASPQQLAESMSAS